MSVGDYFDMLHKEVHGESFSKAEHRRVLQLKLNNRSEGSIEYKYQNISAVLLGLGLPYISGYKPAFNYQAQLKQSVLAYLARNPSEFDSVSVLAEELSDKERFSSLQWEDIYDPEIPDSIAEIKLPQRNYLARKRNYAEREMLNQQLGDNGEELVFNVEIQRLMQAGRKDLADEVTWISKDEGDGAGFDIRSFEANHEREIYIEVKTTNSGKYSPFFISENERAFSNEYQEHFRLYRLYEFSRSPRLFVLPGAIEAHAYLLPQNYKALLGGA